LPIHTLQRAVFNCCLKAGGELTVGFDMDGYSIAGCGHPHIAALKGVIADEVRFERGFTRATMSWQAARGREHVHRADVVIATSRYSAEQACEFYRLRSLPKVVPELIDLAEWRQALAKWPRHSDASRFTVLSVGRLYRRKRIDVLLQAAARLRER